MDSGEIEMTTEQFLALRADVKAILNALEGSERFGQKGLIDRLAENEHKVKKGQVERDAIKNDLKNFKTKIIAYTSGAAAVATAVIQLLMSYLT